MLGWPVANCHRKTHYIGTHACQKGFILHTINTINNMALDWDSYISPDTSAAVPVVLAEGDYAYTVTHLRRDYHPGSARLTACPKAVITLRIDVPQGPVYIRNNLYLHRSLQWALVSFFDSLGLMQGTSMVMPWDRVVGARGWAHIGVHSYTGKDGVTHTCNVVRRYISKHEEDKYTNGR